MKKIILNILICMFEKVRTYKIRKILIELIKCFDDKSYEKLNYLIKKYYNIDIGKYSYGCHFIDGTIEPGTVIGRYCSIAPGVRIGGLNHPLYYVTTHPILYNKVFGYQICDMEVKPKQVIIENDVWIGFNCTILGGVKIGNGAVIGAGSVVTKDVPPYAIVAGNPAQIIKYRFNDVIISELQNIRWYEKDNKFIDNNIQLMYEPQKFIDLFKTK